MPRQRPATLFALRDDLDFAPSVGSYRTGSDGIREEQYVATALTTRADRPSARSAGGVGARARCSILQKRGVRASARLHTRQAGASARSRGRSFPTAQRLPALILEATGGRGVDAVFDSVGSGARGRELCGAGSYGHWPFGRPADRRAHRYRGGLRSVSPGELFWLGAGPAGGWDTATPRGEKKDSGRGGGRDPPHHGRSELRATRPGRAHRQLGVGRRTESSC